jgi:membrane protein YqaA with SNARE-associated domain
MEQSLLDAVYWLLDVLALPHVGLPTIFLVTLISATLLPLGSEPVVFGYVKLVPEMFWPAVWVATVGNTLGGMISYAMGVGAHKAFGHKVGGKFGKGRWDGKARDWIRRMGPPALLLSWLPGVGDPLCAAAGWLRLAFWPSVVYMAIGKFLRFVIMTAVLLWMADRFL